MSVTRTQIYLTEAQRQKIDRVTASEGIPMAEVIRRALDEYLKDDADASTALRSTIGAVPGAEAPSRNEWQRG
jgi:metal-responsive CopG/Arc/MetJ family transcriptional regulator